MELSDVNYRFYENQVSSNIQWSPSVRGSIPQGGPSFSKIDFSPTLKKLTDLKNDVNTIEPVSTANITMPPPPTREDRYANAFVAAIKRAEDVKAYQSQSGNAPSLPTIPTNPVQVAPSIVVPTEQPTASMDGVMVGGVHHTVQEAIATQPAGATPEISVQTNFHYDAPSTGKAPKKKGKKKKPYDKMPGAYPSPVSPTMEEQMAPYMDTYANRWAAGITGTASVQGKKVEYNHGKAVTKFENPAIQITRHLPSASPTFKIKTLGGEKSATRAEQARPVSVVSFTPRAQVVEHFMPSQTAVTRPTQHPKASMNIPTLAPTTRLTSVSESETPLRKQKADDVDPERFRPSKRQKIHHTAPIVRSSDIELAFPPTAFKAGGTGNRAIRHPKGSYGIPEITSSARLPRMVSEEARPLRRPRLEEVQEWEARPAKKQKMWREEVEPIRRRPGNTYDPSVFGLPTGGAAQFRAGRNAMPLREIARTSNRNLVNITPVDHAIPPSAPFAFRGASEPTVRIRDRPRASEMPSQHVRKKQRRE